MSKNVQIELSRLGHLEKMQITVREVAGLLNISEKNGLSLD